MKEPLLLVVFRNFAVGLLSASGIGLFMMALQNSKIFSAILMFGFAVGIFTVFGWLVLEFLAFVAMIARGGDE